MKNKNLLIVGIVVLVLALAGGYYFFVAQKSSTEEELTPSEQDASVPKLSPEDIGLEMEASADSRKVKFAITKASDIKHLEYELSWDADIPKDLQLDGAEEDQKITRAKTGEADIEGEETYETEFLDLGTCSSGTCKYDTGVEKVSLILKITKSDGKVYQVEDSLTL